MLFIDGFFASFTIEDEFRVPKIPEETRIPAGFYKIGLTYSPKFTPKYGHKMLQILDVPGFDRILIHPGNTEKDTAGCILVGNVCKFNEAPGMSSIQESKLAYDRLHFLLATAVENGNVYIDIKDNDVRADSLPV